MAFGEHWEWRAFGRLSSAEREAIGRLPRKYATSLKQVHEYLYVPDCAINVKLQGEYLKFKRFLGREGAYERWLEDRDEFYPFPVARAQVEQLVEELGVTLPSPLTESSYSRDRLLDLLENAGLGIQVLAVKKERWQYDSEDHEGRAVIVELAEIASPEVVTSVSYEADTPEALAAMLESMPRPAGMEVCNYLEALAVWSRGERLV